MTSPKVHPSELEYMAYELNRFMRESSGPLSDKERQQNLLNCYSSFSSNGAVWNSASEEGLTIIHTAAGYDSVPTIETLISLGMDKYTHDNQGNTLLHHAFSLLGPIEYGGYGCEVINWAVQNGFDINTENDLGQTPIFLLGHFLSDQDPEDPDIQAIHYVDAKHAGEHQETIKEIIKEFEKLGGDIAHKDHKGRTFVDCLPSHNPDWSLLDPALNECRVKIEKMRLLEVVDFDGKKQKLSKKM